LILFTYIISHYAISAFHYIIAIDIAIIDITIIATLFHYIDIFIIDIIITMTLLPTFSLLIIIIILILFSLIDIIDYWHISWYYDYFILPLRHYWLFHFHYYDIDIIIDIYCDISLLFRLAIDDISLLRHDAATLLILTLLIIFIIDIIDISADYAIIYAIILILRHGHYWLRHSLLIIISLFSPLPLLISLLLTLPLLMILTLIWIFSHYLDIIIITPLLIHYWFALDTLLLILHYLRH